MRPDGLPWFWNDVVDLPNEPDPKQRSNFTIDHFGLIVAQCLTMHQGRIKLPQEGSPQGMVQLPYAMVPLKEGLKAWNYRTGTEYEIRTVHNYFRGDLYEPDWAHDAPELRPLPSRTYVGFTFHPDELTGAAVQLAPVGNAEYDIDINQGDFLVLESSARVDIRQAYGETRDFPRSGYGIRYRVTRSEPGIGKEPFDGNRGPRAQLRPYNIETHDSTVLIEVNGQTFDSLVEFELEARNAVELNVLTQWFEVFMDRHIPTIQRCGFNHVSYWDRREPEAQNRDEPLTGGERKLRYFVRWERLWPTMKPKLRRVTIELTPLREE